MAINQMPRGIPYHYDEDSVKIVKELLALGLVTGEAIGQVLRSLESLCYR